MAAPTSVGAIKKHFYQLRDPRVVGRTQHRLSDIIALAACAVIGNCGGWPDIALLARKRQAWSPRFLKLPNGVPCHDTLKRVFGPLAPGAFGRCCLEGLRVAADLVGVRPIASDGKTRCGSANPKLGALHPVGAWAVQADLGLGQVAVDGKSNGLTAIPQLLALLDRKGALVTLDARGCQKEAARKVVAGGHVLAVKGNQEHLREGVQTTGQQALEGELPAGVVELYTTRERGHGRQEERTYVAVPCVGGTRDKQAWPKLTAVGRRYSERAVNGQARREGRYFIGSRRMKAHRYAKVLRNHGRIENCLPWQLGVRFGEDGSHIQERHGAETFALLRRLALSMPKQPPRKQSIARKRKEAALGPAFLAETLAGATKVEKV